MVEVQIICKNTTKAELEKKLEDFGDLRIIDRKQHLRIALDDEGQKVSRQILEKCREISYAYLRLTCWEQGGCFDRTGRAVCVAGLEGEPLSPISVRVRGERANSRHALFCSRKGLVVAEAQRLGEVVSITLWEYRVSGFELIPGIQRLETEVKGGGPEVVEGFLEKLPIEQDKYASLLRGLLRKIWCRFCTHVHYRSLEEDRETSSE